MGRLYLDFETKSELDLKEVGAFKYAEHPSTDILLLAYLSEGQSSKVNLWEPSMLKFKPLWNLVNDPSTRYYAWNATFDLLIWEHVMHRKYDWPMLPDRVWFDVMAVSCFRAFPANLDKASKALKAPAKADSGTKLINFFSKPNAQGTFNDPLDHLEAYETFRAYARTDVISCYGCHKRLGDLPPRERKLWLHTLEINRRGIHVDTGLCRSVVHHIDKKRGQLDDLVAVHTGGEVTKITQRERLRTFIQREYGVGLANMQGTYLNATLNGLKNSKEKGPRKLRYDKARTLLTWYLQGGKSSTAKYQKVLDQVCADGTIKGFLFYHGAGTGRYSGKGVQLQNFPNQTVDNAEDVIGVLSHRDTELVELVIGELFELSKKLLRSVLVAPAGKQFCVGDYKSIEMVGSAWAAGERSVLEDFKNGIDPYTRMASQIFDKDYAAINKDERQAGKVVVLACGFGGHKMAVLNMATKFGMTLSDSDAAKLANQFRYARPALVEAWASVEQTLKAALASKEGKIFSVPRVRGMALMRVGEDIRMLLPSGREINYPFAHTTSVISHIPEYNIVDGNTKMYIDVREMNAMCSDKGQWVERPIYGSLLFQNYVQGLCRDILAEGQLRLEESGFPICVDVHDELGGLVSDGSEHTLNTFLSIMTRRPSWLPNDFPISADGYISKRYKK